MQNRFARFAPLLALATLTLLIFRELAFTDWILGRGDTFTYFYPYWTIRDGFLRAGQLPLWTPDLFMGAPLLANPQVGALYPPNWLTIYLDAPDAVRVSVLLHVLWGTLGAYWLARRAAGLSRPAATVTAALFGLGGYLGGHVEQINQLQGLAWLPWVFGLVHLTLKRPAVRMGSLLAMAVALQILSGHTQTVFICGVGCGVYVLASGRLRGRQGLAYAGAAGLALLLASAQLIPTLELIAQSGREGGLTANAALSFSLNPFIAGRGLLPSYAGKVFSEYIAYVGVSGLMLAVWGSWASADASDFPRQRVWLIVGGVGLFLALGAYNPLNWLLVQVPGFDLFRVPARWLALYALSVAVLAGIGTDTLLQRRVGWRPLLIATGVILALGGASFLAVRVPEEINGPAMPSLITLAAWSAALLVTVAVAWLPGRWRVAVVPLVFIELAAAAWVMPYNDLVPPEVWHAQRFSISQMLAETETDADGLTADGTPPGRLLSISGLLFDPGDKAALSARYQTLGMTPLEERYSFVAAKLKETLSPNLPLAWGIPGVDGYGGGLLPTRHYNTLMQLVYPPVADIPGDGRLRENLAREDCRGACLPSERVLRLLGVEYLLADKVFDVWHDGVAFSTVHHGRDTYAGQPFVADAVQVLFACEDEPCRPQSLAVTGDGQASDYDTFTVEPVSDGVYVGRVTLPRWAVERVQVQPGDESMTTLGVTLVDRAAGLFEMLPAPPGWEQILSSDVRLFRYTDVPPRAITTTDFAVVDGDAEALARLQNGTPTVIHTETDALPAPDANSQESTATFSSYTATYVAINSYSSQNEILVLYDSYYPGWRATVNGNDTPIYRTNINVRSVALPAGSNQAIFTYDPYWLPGIFIVDSLVWAITITLSLLTVWRHLND